MIFDHPYRNLLIALVLTFMGYPILIVGGGLGRTLELLLLILVMATASLVRFGRTRRSLWVIGLSGIVILIWAVSLLKPDFEFLRFIRVALVVGYMGMIAGWLLEDVFRARNVSSKDRLYGSMAMYLVIGVFFGNLYSAVNVLAPGSFECVTNLCQGDFANQFERGWQLYYSFVTLTTLGFGDIVPTTTVAAMLSSLEAIVGQLYVAIVVVRLVGIHLMDSARKDGEPP
jgi:hypothetical protein